MLIFKDRVNISICMKGSISYEKDRGYWSVNFPMPGNTPLKIRHYKGERMLSRKIAEKCLAAVQADYEAFLDGKSPFCAEKYGRKAYTDVVEFMGEWLRVKESKKPATIKGYRSYLKCHFEPFFHGAGIMLHEIQLDTLMSLMASLKNANGEALSPKMRYNVMNCFHAFMDYAWRSRRIPEVPPFPKKEDYGLVEKPIMWLSETTQMRIIDAIPVDDRPIFLWLKYHYRRPAEACVLRWEDYDHINQIFTIRRSVSAREVVESTKTASVTYQPCDPDFLPVIRGLWKTNQSGYIFKNKRARKDGSRYTGESLNILWRNACQKTGIEISLYNGLKHSSCSQFINEKSGTVDELQMLTDHARRDSVLKYAKVGTGRKLELMKKRKLSITQPQISPKPQIGG